MEKLVLELAEAQSEALDVALCFGVGEGPFWERAQSFLAYDLKLGGWLANPLRVAAARRLLGGFSVVHYHYFHPAFLKVRAPGVFTFHGPLGSFRGFKRLWTLPKFKKFLERVRPVAVSRFAARLLEERTGVKPLVVYNGLFLERVKPKRSPGEVRRELGLRGPAVGFAGHLTPVKRVELLLRALRGTGVKALVIGEGPERGRLEALARELGVEAAFLGARDDVYDLVAACDAFVMPTRGETFGLAALEAMALGVPPLVMADGGGLLELVGYPELVARDADELREKILWLVEDPEEREYWSGLVRERALGFHIVKTAKAYEALYREVLSG